MNVLVVGGAGYIGSHCVRQLQAGGFRAVVLDNFVYGHRAALSSDTPVYEGDLGDRKILGRLFEEEAIDVVMHFAAFAYVGESVQKPLKYYHNNLAQPIALLEEMIERGLNRFIFSSSCSTYGEPDEFPITEDTPRRPINPYGQTKLGLELLLRSLARAHGFSFATFRYFNAAGASADGAIGEDHDPESHLIPLAIGAAQGARPPLQVFGTDYPTPDGTCLRDYVHVEDICQAHIDIIARLNSPGKEYFYNLGTGNPTSVREVIGTVASVSGKKVPFVEVERRPGDPPVLYADASKARKELGWTPRYAEIRSIVETAWRWHRSHPRGFSSGSQ